MTHLRIELNNGIIEEVSDAVIDKLYNIIHSGTLDNNSNLIGRLHTSAAYQDYIDYLEDIFKINGVKLLIIDATKKYIRFTDSAVLSRMLQYLGDGVGITSSEITNGNWYSNTTDPNTNRTLFTNNTSITSFNELGLLSLITNIPNNTFNGCTNLTTIDLHNITSIGNSAFLNCSKLTSVDLSNVTSISDEAFSLCSELTSINLSSCTSLGIGAFLNCTSLTTVTLNPLLTSIPKGCFKNCTSLSSIDTSNITNLGNDTFEGCSNIQLLDLSSLTNIRPEGGMLECYTFRNCSSLTIVDLPNITQLPFYLTFNGCSNLRAVMFPNATDCGRLDYRNFGGCTSLVYVKFGLCEIELKGINQWSGGFFKNAQNLTVLDLGNTKEIDDWAIVNCTNIKAVVFRYSSVVPIILAKSGSLSMSSLFGGSTNVSIFVPDELVTDYQQDLSWSVMSSAIKPISTYNLDDYITSDYYVRLSL